MKKYDVIIIGGGAAGLACAVRIAENSKLKILIIEAGERAGRKLAATGNGQGNVSNVSINISNYFSGNLNIVDKIACSSSDGIWFDGLDVFGNMLFQSDERGRVYPSGRQASALVDSLLFSLKRRGVEILLSTKVVSIKRGFEITCDSGEKFSSKYVVIAVGGKAQKQFKTDGSSYNLAKQLGHNITPLYPSLVQLKTNTAFIKTLKGIRADCIVRAKVSGNTVKSTRGDVIFTDYGVSGNAIFTVSPSFASDKGMLEIDFLPDFSSDQITAVLIKRKQFGVQTAELLSGLVHNQIGRAVIKRAASDDVNLITAMLKYFTLEVTGSLGFDYAQVTRGGVDMKDISDKLESKLVKNLYFAGEVLDVDGDCGGYNLHWAFTSAKAVANAILKR